ncbi:hypothetical protein KTO58_18225 [Chitinophaga pendula]|uniref:hypothetical protein n=1 Tax=Chitinophaga TaxID=79328 RepID=UPI000BAF3447|nr:MULTISPECIES: hypothetical protein [Chitinophaga]ASZ11382.1 hypothetical protein CK934_10590 [Chitinophaga sp. MD30]UCJ05614.1 hypothetical protein KTO58_18225 [Chitinophaga pendula]
MQLTAQIKLWILVAALAGMFVSARAQSGATPSITVDSAELFSGNAGVEEEDLSATEAAEAEDTVATPPPHHLWDAEMPLSTDTSSDWWLLNRPMIRSVDSSIVKEIQGDKRFNYQDKVPKQTRNWAAEILMHIIHYLLSVSDLIIILVVLGLLAILFYFLRHQGVFRRHSKKITEELPGQEEEEITVAGAYEQKIQAAVAAGQYRLAVRLLYLQALRILESKQLIAITKDKTNADYLRALYKTQWYSSFAGITLDYEYIWYGEMLLNDEQFKQVYGQFRAFKNELGYTA